MGITGLLPLLSSITQKKHISEYKGLRCGIDGYVWLHRGVLGCSYELCMNIKTDVYINYFIGQVNFLMEHGLIPTIVFDGGSLPSKNDTEITRRNARLDAKLKASEAQSKGDMVEARKYYNLAVNVTSKMAKSVIEKLKDMQVNYIIAPYEADPQLAYLANNGLIDVIITEDSDMIPYGCPRTLFKLNKEGYVDEINFKDLSLVTAVDFSTFSLEMIRYLCILSGCDYLDNIPKMGLKKSYALLHKHNGDMVKVFNELKMIATTNYPMNYHIDFAKADLTFQHQVVFDPFTQKTIHLNELPNNINSKDIEFAGKILDPLLSVKIANGDYDPNTHQPF